MNLPVAGSVHTAVQVSDAPPVAAGLDDEGAVHAAYLVHGPELYRFAVRGLGDPGAAEDVVQETFLRAWRARDRFDADVASLRVWLFAIARNAVIDHARAAGARPWQGNLIDPPSAEAAAGAVDDGTEQLMRSWALEEALQRLSPEHRQALVETALKERPHLEVAADLGIPVGTVRSRIFYGLKALRIALDEMGVTP